MNLSHATLQQRLIKKRFHAESLHTCISTDTHLLTNTNITQSTDMYRWKYFALGHLEVFFVILQDCDTLHKPFFKSRPENPDHKVTKSRNWAVCLRNTFQKQFDSIQSDDIYPINCLRKAAGQIPLSHLANYNLW